MDAIYERRSIRKFKEEPIPREKLLEFIKAGMNAPSAGNQQPWHFMVIDDRDLLDKVTLFHPYAQMLLHAPAAILVCGDLEREIHRGYWVQDCSAATENILLEIAGQGYGAVWLGIHPIKEREVGCRELFKIPQQIVPLAMIALGKPDERKEKKNIFKEERVHYNGWE